MDFTDAQQYIFQGATVNNVGGNQTNINNVFNNAPSPPSSLSWQEIFVNTFSTRQQIQAKEQLHIARGNATTQLKATLTVLNACGGGDHVNDQISAFREEIADLQMIVDAIDVSTFEYWPRCPILILNGRTLILFSIFRPALKT
jgi:hypothetical protein